jgi:hypothetical protein
VGHPDCRHTHTRLRSFCPSHRGNLSLRPATNLATPGTQESFVLHRTFFWQIERTYKIHIQIVRTTMYVRGGGGEWKIIFVFDRKYTHHHVESFPLTQKQFSFYLSVGRARVLCVAHLLVRGNNRTHASYHP